MCKSESMKMKMITEEEINKLKEILSTQLDTNSSNDDDIVSDSVYYNYYNNVEVM